MTPEEMAKQINVLTRVIGNQAVMLHSLKEKVQSIYNLRDFQDDFGTQIFEIVDNLNQWANECDQTPKFDFSEFAIRGDVCQDAYVSHSKCEAFLGDVSSVTEAILLAESHVCPNSNQE